MTKAQENLRDVLIMGWSLLKDFTITEQDKRALKISEVMGFPVTPEQAREVTADIRNIYA